MRIHTTSSIPETAMRAKVTVKEGDVSRTSRTDIPILGDDIDFELDASFQSFSAVGGHVAQSLAAYSTPTTRIDMRMHLRPSVHAAQKDIVPLTADNFRQCIADARLLFEDRCT
ncbi:hypothetical protein BBJ28_00020480 [Nothophytophthora sp. Chile5]|nr:hypothetical protein BBJ28_00020480 [Nothophytophthora sp. Chile5]